MRVLIAGCGYVGLALGKKLASQGHTVFGLRRRSAGAEIEDLKAAGIVPLSGDIADPASLRRLPGAYDWVVHCASAGSGEENYRRVYVEGNRNLIDWLTPALPQKFVYTSSTSVYGQNDGSLVDETSPTTPTSPSAKLLVEAEQILQRAALEQQFPAVILRVAGIYGPGRGYWFKAFASREARLEGTGERSLNMVHREDVAGAVIAALERGRPGQIYNVADDEPVSQRAFFEWLSKELRKPMPPSQVGPETGPSRRGGT